MGAGFRKALQTEELCHALGVEIGSADLNPENITELQIVLASCLGLVTVEMSLSTVRLVHFTLQEYLSVIRPYSIILTQQLRPFYHTLSYSYSLTLPLLPSILVPRYVVFP